MTPKTPAKTRWDLLVLDAAPASETLSSLVTGDLDGDGHQEVVTGGGGGLLWYRPDTFEKEVIDEGQYGVALIAADVDGDGEQELVCSRLVPEPWNWQLVFYKREGSGWTRHLIDEANDGGAHDLLFVDVDGDGEGEIVANAAYCKVPGLYIHKWDGSAWQRHVVSEHVFAEGLAAADLDGDGRLELVHGPDWFKAPAAGPYSGPWRRSTYAPSHREMCRVATLDISGSGSPDILIVDSEYLDGRLSWFENRLAEGSGFTERLIDTPVVYGHSLSARLEGTEATVFLAEMAQGGWDPPYNWDARIMRYLTPDGGKTWRREVLAQGQGTHEAELVDIDGDGAREVVGKEVWRPRVHIWKERQGDGPFAQFKHQFIDRDKSVTGTDIIAADVDGDGLNDIVCAKWWYKNPGWERFEIPGVYQAIGAYDLDGDERVELIATKKAEGAKDDWYTGLSSELVWLKPINPERGEWEEHAIGTGSGDWPHGNLVAPLLPGGRLALVTTYHSAHAGGGDPPEIFEVPDDPTAPWPKRTLASIPYGEEVVAHDLTGDGTLDLVMGTHWLENHGDGTFTPHRLIADESFYPARLRVLDVDGDGEVEVVMGEEKLDYETKSLPFSKLAYFKPGDDLRQPWVMHIIDTMRCPHSVEVADLDGDGELEIIAGEHDPFWPYRNRSRLYVYKKANPEATAFYRYTLDKRFEHHCGTKLIDLGDGRLGVMSHGWNDSIYVNLWAAAEVT